MLGITDTQQEATNPDMTHTEAFQPPSNAAVPMTELTDPGDVPGEAGLCAACGGKIVDRYFLLAVDKQWHVHCLKCSDCQLPLDTEVTCFAKDGNIYCKEDYYRRFGVKRCARCHMGISANELVMRARDLVYHLNCFTCASCNKVLTTGEHFGMQDTMIYCRIHYEMLLHGEFIPVNHAYTDSQHHVSFYNGVGTTQKGRPRKRKSPLSESDPQIQSLGFDGLADDYHTSQSQRQKRMRTSFKHHQLRAMKSYFALNHNPDAKELKQLAEKTGLNKRVLQVWFQNARAKYRRNLLKQEQDKPSGTPETQQASSPGQDSGKATLADLSNASRSPGSSDISSTPTLSDLQGSSLEPDQFSTNSTLTELFTSSISAMN